MRTYEYLTTHKGEEKRTCILQKEEIQFYRKRDSGILHQADKVCLEFSTQKNRVKNATVTQWQTDKTLCLVRI